MLFSCLKIRLKDFWTILSSLCFEIPLKKVAFFSKQKVNSINHCDFLQPLKTLKPLKITQILTNNANNKKINVPTHRLIRFEWNLTKLHGTKLTLFLQNTSEESPSQLQIQILVRTSKRKLMWDRGWKWRWEKMRWKTRRWEAMTTSYRSNLEAVQK